ncbi:MAG: signal peptidase [Patescibacteria group bacterium]|jgi:signal peptidase I|nr:signal peptidase [Patescibacteria group bacterium]
MAMNEEKNDSLTPETKKKSTLKGIIREVFIFALIAFGIVLPFRMYIAEPYLVDGRSMDPTFATGDYLIVDKISYAFNAPERNSVVVLKYPKDTNKSFIKRIVGLPGETVIIKDNVVTIVNAENPDGFVVDGSYVTHTSTGSYEKELEEDEYYVLGDNRAESFDSRFWGPLQKKYIIGRPIIRLFPLTKIDILPGKYYEKN